MASQQPKLTTCPFTKPQHGYKLDKLTMRQGTKAIRCHACRARQARSTRCNATTFRGCIECSKFGLPCVVDNWALPPHPERWTGPTNYMTWTCCNSCATIHSCDRAQPCQSCIETKNEANCAREFPKGLYNGRVPGDDMYGYYICLGPDRGPNGPRDKDVRRQYADFRQGDNYHVEYAYNLYWRNGWLQNHWHGPPVLSFPGAPEVAASQGPIYVGPPPGVDAITAGTSQQDPAAPNPPARPHILASDPNGITSQGAGPGFAQPNPNHIVATSAVNDLVSASPSIFAPVTAPWAKINSVSAPSHALGPSAAPWVLGNSVLAPPHDFAPVEAPITATVSVLDPPPAWGPEWISGADAQAKPPAQVGTFYFASEIEPSQSGASDSGSGNSERPFMPESQTLVEGGLGIDPDPELGSAMKILKMNYFATADPSVDSFNDFYIDSLLASDNYGNEVQDVLDPMDIDEISDAEGVPQRPQTPPLPPRQTSPWRTWVNWASPSNRTVEPNISAPELSGRSLDAPQMTTGLSDLISDQTSAVESALRDAILDQMLTNQLPSINHIPIDPRLIHPLSVPGQLSTSEGEQPAGDAIHSLSSGTLPLPPLLPTAPPKPVGPSPLSPADLVAQNPAVFQQYQRRIENYWTYWISDTSIIPAGQISQAWIAIARDWLNPRGSMISRTPEPVERPSSPGPLLQLFTTDKVGSRQPDHPAHTDTYPQGRRPLALIPKHRIWEEGALAPIAGLCECGQWTHGICESTDHHPARRCFVCSKCDWTARQNLWALLGQDNFDVVNNIRRFACRMCTSLHLANPSRFSHSGLEIYDSPTRQDAAPRFDARNMTNNAYGNEGLIIRGGVYQTLPVTGCPCFSKLMERRLCNAHRCQGFFDVVQRMYAMANYVRNHFREASGDVCFICHSTPQQMPGGSDNSKEAGKLWACLGCSGIVMGARSEELISMATYSPYPDHLPGRHKPILLPPKNNDAQTLATTRGHQSGNGNPPLRTT